MVRQWDSRLEFCLARHRNQLDRLAGVWVENAGFAGVEATGTKGDGVLGITKDVDNAGKAGIHGYATGGLFRGVVGQDGSGTDASWGLMTLGYPNPTDNNGDAFIQDDLVVNGNCSGCATAFIAKNGDAEALTPGVVVMITGVGELDPRLSGQRPLLLVQAAGQPQALRRLALLGVVLEGAPPKIGTGIAGNGTTRELIPSGGYLVVATPGQLVQMNVAATAGGRGRGCVDARHGGRRCKGEQCASSPGNQCRPSGPRPHAGALGGRPVQDLGHAHFPLTGCLANAPEEKNHVQASRLSLLCILICCCLLVGTVPVQSSPQQQPSPRSYAVMPTTLSGGGYQLVEPAWRVNGAITAGKYRLEILQRLR